MQRLTGVTRSWILLGVLLLVAGILVLALDLWTGRDLTINQVLVNAAALNEQSVVVRGVVVSRSSVLLLNTKLFVLHDVKAASGTLTVVTAESLPAVGDIVRVRGRVRNAVVFDGQSFGTLVQEERRLLDPLAWFRRPAQPRF